VEKKDKYSSAANDGNLILRPFPFIEIAGSGAFRRSYPTKAHRHAGIEIHGVKKGTFIQRIDSSEVKLVAGEVSVSLPWEENRAILNESTMDYIVIVPKMMTPSGEFRLGNFSVLTARDEAFIGKALTRSSGRPIRNCPTALHLLGEIVDEIRGSAPGRGSRVRLLVSDLLLAVARCVSSSTEGGEKHALPSNLIEEVASSPELKLSIRALAEKTTLSMRRVSAEFKRTTGFTPQKFRDVERIEKAKLLLLSGKSVTDVAYELNYSSSQHFSVMFKRHAGCTPSGFVKKKRAG
jgi:AraC family L-rhamnose operon regulatory protein RhaS